MSWGLYPLLVGAGFVAGFVNTLAGSGSAVTLPLLIFMGLPASVANGTNRVAIVLQTVAAVSGFRQQGVLDRRGALILSIPAVLGSLIGAQVSLGLDEQLLRKCIGSMMLVLLVVILLRPTRWLHGTLERMSGQPTSQQVLLFFFIGIYGGFIQVGVGIWLLVGLVLGLGYDLVRANAVKVAIVFSLTLAALAVFVLNGQVQWREGLILAVGNMLGARAGTRFAVERGVIWVRRVLIAIVLFSASQLLGVATWISRLL
jgi:uncharacterized membrane protein YfcA